MSTLAPSLLDFAQSSSAIQSTAKLTASSLPANKVQVWPGGAMFDTIQAAIDSISNAGPQLQYQLAVGAGTFNENVVMKDYVYITGAGQDITFITAAGQMNFRASVVNSASNCGISELTINATGGGWGCCPIGIKIVGGGKFHISGVNINASDSGTPGNNVRGISNNTGSYTGSVILGQSVIQASGVNDTTVVGIDCFGNQAANGFTIFINLSTVQAQSQSQSFGVSTAVAASATLENSKIIAGTYSLYNSDGGSPIVANQCTIDGPVSGGVVVNP